MNQWASGWVVGGEAIKWQKYRERTSEDQELKGHVNDTFINIFSIHLAKPALV